MGATFIHPFEDEDVIAGQGTIGLEILDQLPDPDMVLVPIGGGGLAAGVAFAVKSLKPDVKVIGVQAQNASAFAESFKEAAAIYGSFANNNTAVLIENDLPDNYLN